MGRDRRARAGHLPPVPFRGPGTTALPLVKVLLLGALPEAPYEEGEVRPADGETPLMHTDGLIERRDRSVEESLAPPLTTARAGAGEGRAWNTGKGVTGVRGESSDHQTE